MLGEASATDQLPWLAGHLGDDYAETTIGDVTVATYIESADDPTRIYVEVDGPAAPGSAAPGLSRFEVDPHHHPTERRVADL